MMRISLLIALLLPSTRFVFAEAPAPIRTERTVLRGGEGWTERTFRGEDEKFILFTMALDGHKSRVFRVNGETIMIEADEDGDGSLETIMVENPRDQRFDMFKRGEDGTVAPLDGQSLVEIIEKMFAAHTVFDAALREAIHESAQSDAAAADYWAEFLRSDCLAEFPDDWVAEAMAPIRIQQGVLENGGGTVERIFRGKKCIMVAMVLNGHESRHYLVGGEVVVSESDEDGDGRLETLTVMNPVDGSFEAFKRGEDGSVVPLYGKSLAEFTEKRLERRAALHASLDPAVREDTESHDTRGQSLGSGLVGEFPANCSGEREREPRIPSDPPTG